MPEGLDFVVGQNDSFPATPVARWDANIRAIRLSRELETQKRAATVEEQREMSMYSGFGDSAFEPAFSPYGTREEAWKRRRTEIEELVSSAEYEGIKRSRKNAFYTTPEVVKAMWKGVSDMGADKLPHPRVLEPSAGSGRFLGLQPKEMADKSKRFAVELDPMTAGIVKHVYPQTNVFNAGFEEVPFPNDYFDVAISNVPFGKVKVYDKEFNATGRQYLTNSIHNYFFAKTLDKLKPGGVMAFVTSHHTLDAKKAEPDAVVMPTEVAPVPVESAGGATLYQGHWGKGIGDLKPDNPTRRDGDGDTVVAERRPRKNDEYERSPLPVPDHIAAKYAKIAAALIPPPKARKKRSSKSPPAGLKEPNRGTSSVKVVIR